MIVSHESSHRGSEVRLRSSSQSGLEPTRLGSQIITVFGVIAPMMFSTVGTYAVGSMSTKIGLTPSCCRGAMTVENVHAAVTTSSPGLKPKALRAIRLAEEPELTMRPIFFAKRSAHCVRRGGGRGEIGGETMELCTLHVRRFGEDMLLSPALRTETDSGGFVTICCVNLVSGVGGGKSKQVSWRRHLLLELLGDRTRGKEAVTQALLDRRDLLLAIRLKLPQSGDASGQQLVRQRNVGGTRQGCVCSAYCSERWWQRTEVVTLFGAYQCLPALSYCEYMPVSLESSLGVSFA